MKERRKVYVETSALSVLVARRSLNAVELARQTLTRAWWKRRREMILFTSRAVRDEIATGDLREAKKRLAVAGLFIDLPVTAEAEDLAKQLLLRGALPAKAATDAIHLAVAAVHRMDFLVSWNCRHLVNTNTIRQAFRVFEPAGYNVPDLKTPESFLEL
jgi:hypothetical protein